MCKIIFTLFIFCVLGFSSVDSHSATASSNTISKNAIGSWYNNGAIKTEGSIKYFCGNTPNLGYVACKQFSSSQYDYTWTATGNSTNLDSIWWTFEGAVEECTITDEFVWRPETAKWECMRFDSCGDESPQEDTACIAASSSGTFLFGNSYITTSFYPNGMPIPETFVEADFPGYGSTGEVTVWELKEDKKWYSTTLFSDGTSVSQGDGFPFGDGEGESITAGVEEYDNENFYDQTNTDLSQYDYNYVPITSNDSTNTITRDDGSTIAESTNTVKNADGTSTTTTQTTITYADGSSTTTTQTATSGTDNTATPLSIDTKPITDGLTGLGDTVAAGDSLLKIELEDIKGWSATNASKLDSLGGKLDGLKEELDLPEGTDVPSTSPGDYDGSITPEEYALPDYDTFTNQVKTSPVDSYLDNTSLSLVAPECTFTTQAFGKDIVFSLCDWETTFSGMGVLLASLAHVIALFIVFRGE